MLKPHERTRREAELQQARRDAEERARREAAAQAARALALANTCATLHAQAVAVYSIKTLVPIVLDVDSANYSKWSNLILNTLSKYALDDHVLSDDDF